MRPVRQAAREVTGPHTRLSPAGVRHGLSFTRMDAEKLRKHHEHQRESLGRYHSLTQGIHRMASGEPLKKPLSIKEILTNPEDHKGKAIDVVLTDVDGTTHRGQYWLGWVLDCARYGVFESSGISIPKGLKTVLSSIVLLQAEKKAEVDTAGTKKTLNAVLKEFDEPKLINSLERYFDTFGGEGINTFVRDALQAHAQEGRLVIGLSGSPERLVRRHFDEDLGLPFDNAFGTVVNFDEHGRTKEGDDAYILMQKTNKLARFEAEVVKPLEALGIKVNVVAAFTDSASDESLCLRAFADGGQVTLVNCHNKNFIAKGQREWNAWTLEEDSSKRRVTLSKDPTEGSVEHRQELIPQHSKLGTWTKEYASKMLVDAGVMAAAIVPAQVITSIANTSLDIDQATLWKNAGTTFAAASAATAMLAGVGHMMIPKTGLEPHESRVTFAEALPLAGAMALAYPQLQAGGFMGSLVMALGNSYVATRVARVVGRGVQNTFKFFSWNKLEKFADSRVAEIIARGSQIGLYYALATAELWAAYWVKQKIGQ